MEDRVVLSHVGLPLVAAAVHPTHHPMTLDGVVQGSVTFRGDVHLLQGSGRVAPLGNGTANGSLAIRLGEPTFYDGELTLLNRSGSVTLRIKGIQGGPSGPAAHLPYDILGGTGAYLGATGHGLVAYEQGGPLIVLDSGPHVSPGIRGTFALAFGHAVLPLLPL
jgi:hypothetical protein